MQAPRPTTPALKNARRGFTLVELMMVILIIAALIALILPAVQGAIGRARASAVKAELTRLDTAIAAFKTRYNTNPPSYLAIPPVGTSWTGGFASSKRSLRKIWPQFDFSTNGGLSNSDPYILSGAECLVLFLGGIPSSSGALDGFSKNPSTPFATGGENRDGPFYEFDAGRLTDVDGDTIAEFLDEYPGQTTPILYVALDGRGLAQNAGVPDTFDVFNNNDVSSWLDDMSVGKGNLGGPYYQDTALTVPWKKDSYQLISPGEGGTYGAVNSSGKYVGAGFYKSDYDLFSTDESDNISNFITGATFGG